MKTQKNKTTTKRKQTRTATTKTQTETHISKTKQKQNIKTPFFRMIFHMQSTCFFIKNSSAQSIYVIEIMLYVKCNYFLKAIAFIELFKAIPFSILLIFRISAMRLFIFIIFFSLDL